MGTGKASGENRAVDATKKAIQSPLLETTIDGAKGVLLNVTGGLDLGIFEINAAAQMVQEAADPEANVIFGAVIDEEMGDEVHITVIATWFEENEQFAIRAPKIFGGKTGDSNTQGNNNPTQLAVDKLFSQFDDDDLDVPPFLRNK